jgi:hypothetical protein
VLQTAAVEAQQLGQAHGWDGTTLRTVLDGLTTVLQGHSSGEQVTVSELYTHILAHAHAPRRRVAEVLDELGLLVDDTTPAIRSWIDRSVGDLPNGFASPVRSWLLVLLGGDARTRPRSQPTLYRYFARVRPFLKHWAAEHEHLREVTTGDIAAALAPLRGHQRTNTLVALRSLFRTANKQNFVFTNPTVGLQAAGTEASLLPMTDAEIHAVEQLARTPAQRLIIALAAVHAARTGAIRHLTLDDLDLPNRRITLAGHAQRLGELTHQTLRAWLDHRRATWPHSPNRHVLIAARTALETGPVSYVWVQNQMRNHGITVDRIRADRILHEAFTTGADPLHLALVFNLSHTTASRYSLLAQRLLDGELEHPDKQ